MSIVLHGSGPRGTKLEICPDGSDDLKLTLFWDRSKAVTILVPTKDLVMAIKSIEEERDAHREPTERDSEGDGVLFYERSIDGVIHRAEEELRAMLRDPGIKPIFYPEIAKALRDIYSSHSPKEARDIVRRIKEEYLRPDRPEVRRESSDDLASKAKTPEWWG